MLGNLLGGKDKDTGGKSSRAKKKNNNSKKNDKSKKGKKTKKSATSRMKKRDKDVSAMHTVDEGGSTVEMKKKTKEKEKKEAWVAEEPAKKMIAAALFNAEAIANDFKSLKDPRPTDCDRFMANAPKNRQQESPIGNEKLIKLNHAPDHYINAAGVIVPDFKRKAIVAQIPDVSNLENYEDFWRMIFQEEILSIVVALAPMEGHTTIQQLIPTTAGSFSNVGKMFLNNRKIEQSGGVTSYIIEVLPDGCSNSVNVHVHHISSWKQKKGMESPIGDLVNVMEKIIKTNENTAIVSLNGVGRAGTILTLFTVMYQMTKELKDPKVKEIVEKLRGERSGMVETFEQYTTIHKALAIWFKSKSADEEVVKKSTEYAAGAQ